MFVVNLIGNICPAFRGMHLNFGAAPTRPLARCECWLPIVAGKSLEHERTIDTPRNMADQRSKRMDEIDDDRADRCDGMSDIGIDRFGHFAGLTPSPQFGLGSR